MRQKRQRARGETYHSLYRSGSGFFASVSISASVNSRMPLYRSFSRRRLHLSPDPLSSFDEDARLREDGPALEEEGCDEGGGGGGGRLTRAWCESIKSYPDAFATTQDQRASSAF